MNKEVITVRRRGRPRKNPKESEKNRLSLIFSGVSLLTQKGFEATGLDEVTKKAGLPKGSFYAYYDSKESFGLAFSSASLVFSLEGGAPGGAVSPCTDFRFWSSWK